MATETECFLVSDILEAIIKKLDCKDKYQIALIRKRIYHILKILQTDNWIEISKQKTCINTVFWQIQVKRHNLKIF